VRITAFAASCLNFKEDLPYDDGSLIGFANLLSQVSELNAAHDATDDDAEGHQWH